MKLTRKIIALAIVLCTLGAMMIPGVSVSATDDSEDLTVNFSEEAISAGFNVLASGNWNYNATQLNNMNNAFDNETIDWKFYTGAGTNPVYSGGAYPHIYDSNGVMLRLNGNATGYLPIEFRAPATGKFKLNVTFALTSGSVTSIGAYIVEIPSTEYTGSSLPREISQDAMAVITETAVGTYGSDEVISLDVSKRYALVLFSTAGEGGGTYGNKPTMKSFSLTKQIPNEDLDVVFNNDRAELGISETQAWYNNALFITPVGNAYAQGTVKWHIYKDNTTFLNSGNSGYTFANNNGVLVTGPKLEDTVYYTALEFKAPGTGKYELTVNEKGHQYNMNIKVDVYVVPVGTGYSTKDQLVAALPEVPLLEISPSTTGTPAHTATDMIDMVRGENYLLVLATSSPKAATSQMYITGFKLKAPVAAIAENKYYSIADAAEAAEAAEATGDDVTIQVLKDFTTGAFELPENATLDLKGFTVNAQGNIVKGKITDTFDGDGFLCAAYDSELEQCPGEIILRDVLESENATGNAGWRVYKCDFRSRPDVITPGDGTSEDGSIAHHFWASLQFENEEALKRIEASGQISLVGFIVQWIPSEGEPSQEFKYAFQDTKMEDWAEQEQNVVDGKTLGFFINIKGFQKLKENGELKVTPYILTPLTTICAESPLTYTHEVTQ